MVNRFNSCSRLTVVRDRRILRALIVSNTQKRQAFSFFHLKATKELK